MFVNTGLKFVVKHDFINFLALLVFLLWYFSVTNEYLEYVERLTSFTAAPWLENVGKVTFYMTKACVFFCILSV